METHEDFLKADFEQYQQWMRHYDTSFFSIIKFLYTGYTAIIMAVYVLYPSFPTSIEARIGATLLLFFASTVSSIFLYWLLRNRVYFTKATRFVNEIRGAYLQQEPLGVKNKTQIYTNPDYPPYFNPGSTHSIFLYFTALCSAVLISLAISFLWRTINLPSQITFSFCVLTIITGIIAAIYLIWIISYLKSKEAKK